MTASITVEDCPECQEQCVWCSATRRMCREIGCATQFYHERKCAKGKAEKGKKCATCDGGGKVTMRREIIAPSHDNST